MNLIHDAGNANSNLAYIQKIVERERKLNTNDSEILDNIVGLVERSLKRNREALDTFYKQLEEEELLQ